MPPAPMYESFAVVTILVLTLLVLLARASQAMLDGPDEDGEVPATGAARIERHRDAGGPQAEDSRADTSGDESPWDDRDSPWGENLAESGARERTPDARDGAPDAHESAPADAPERAPEAVEPQFSTGALLANVALSQGVFGAVLAGAAWFAGIPLPALGIDFADPASTGLPAVGIGVAVGVALYAGNELAAVVADAAGVEYSEGLRETLAPDTRRGWVVLLGVVLPIIAGFEELLFRAALVGAFATGFGISPWALAVVSTVAFAAGHGAQGPGGIAVTGLLGFALAGAFVLTESLLVVVVAHYLVNALEFGVHEGLGVEWSE